MTLTAVMVREDLPGKSFASSVTNIYQLSEPYDGIEFVAVTVTDMPRWNYQATVVLPAADADGAPYAAPDGSLAAAITFPLMSHVEALSELGYRL